MAEALLSAPLGSALQSLVEGRWALDELAPQFRAALLERTGPGAAPAETGHRDLLSLTMRFYGLQAQLPAKVGHGPGPGLQDASRAEEVEFWDRAAAHIAPGTHYRAPSDADRRLVASGLAWFETGSPQTYGVFTRWMPRLVPLGGARFGSASHPHLFGCAFLDEATFHTTPQRLAVTLVHELAHHEVFTLNLLDRLVAEEADHHDVLAPFQGRPRPPIGRLHAAHAVWRMSRFEAEAGLDPEDNRRLLRATAETFAEWELTEFAQELWRRLYTVG